MKHTITATGSTVDNAFERVGDYMHDLQISPTLVDTFDVVELRNRGHAVYEVTVEVTVRKIPTEETPHTGPWRLVHVRTTRMDDEIAAICAVMEKFGALGLYGMAHQIIAHSHADETAEEMYYARLIAFVTLEEQTHEEEAA